MSLTKHTTKWAALQIEILFAKQFIILSSNSLSLKMEDSAYDGSVLFLKVNLEIIFY